MTGYSKALNGLPQWLPDAFVESDGLYYCRDCRRTNPTFNGPGMRLGQFVNHGMVKHGWLPPHCAAHCSPPCLHADRGFHLSPGECPWLHESFAPEAGGKA